MIDHIAFLLCVIIISLVLYYSYFYQQSFSDCKEKSVSLIMMLTIYFSILFLLYISFVIFDIGSIKEAFFKNGSDEIVLILSTINIVVYLLFPIIYFSIQVLEEQNLSKNILS